MKRSFLVAAVLAGLLVGACQPPAKPNSQACSAILAAAQELNRTKAAVTGAKPVLIVHQVRESMRSAREQLDKAAAANPGALKGDNITQVRRNLDQMVVELEGTPDDAPMALVKAKLAPSAIGAADAATALYEAACPGP